MKQFLFNVGQFLVKTLHRTENFERLHSLIIKNIDGDPKRFVRLKKALLLLPDNVLRHLNDNQITIFYSKDAKPVGNGKYAGYYLPSEQLIYVWDNGSNGLYWQIITIIHEVGHFIDFSVGENRFKSCVDKDFHDIAIDEQKYFNKFNTNQGNYYTANIKEYFAQSFAEYFLVPGFKKKCPETALYIESLLNKIA